MDKQIKHFLSPHKLSQLYGIPENKIRADIKRGIAPGFYSGTWFHVNVESYLELLSCQKKSAQED